MLLRDILKEGDISRDEAIAILELPSSFNNDDVIKSHRRKAMRAHPDRGGSNELMSKLNQARDILLGNSQTNSNVGFEAPPKRPFDIFKEKLQDLGARQFRNNMYFLHTKDDTLTISTTGFGHQPVWEVRMGKGKNGKLLGVFDSSNSTLQLLNKTKNMSSFEVEEYLEQNRNSIDEVV